MKKFIICVGGTGARIGEACVHLAATGYFGSGDMELWIVDMDRQCGNGNELSETVTQYTVAQARMDGGQTGCFPQQISFHSWNFNDAINEMESNANGESAFQELGGRNEAVHHMMRLFHDKKSLTTSMKEGFYGRAQTGATLFEACRTTDAFKIKDSRHNKLFAAIQDVVGNDGNEIPQIILCGSSFGATGASLVPNLAVAIRQEFGKRVAIGAVLMLPYFTFKGDSSNNIVHPDTHRQKAATALRYYSSFPIRHMNESIPSSQFFDALYIVGSEPLLSLNEKFVPGGEKQKNNPHITELYAALSVHHFEELIEQTTAGKTKRDSTPATFAYYLNQQPAEGTDSPIINWSRMEEYEVFGKQFLQFTRFSAAILTSVHPYFHKLADYDWTLEKDKKIKQIFGKESLFGPACIDANEARENTDDVAKYAARFLTYLDKIQYTAANQPAVPGDNAKTAGQISIELFDADYLGRVAALCSDGLPKDYDEQLHVDFANLSTVGMLHPDWKSGLSAMVNKHPQNTRFIENMTRIRGGSDQDLKKPYLTHTNKVLTEVYDTIYENIRVDNL